MTATPPLVLILIHKIEDVNTGTGTEGAVLMDNCVSNFVGGFT